MVYFPFKFTYFLRLSSCNVVADGTAHGLPPSPADAVTLRVVRSKLRAARFFDGMYSMSHRDVVIFDLGGVLIDWDPRHLYRKLFDGDEPAMEHFLATVCTQEWNRGQDAGRLVAEAARLLKQQHADKGELIDAFYGRFDEMMAGPISGAV